MRGVEGTLRQLRSLGPYLAIELILPGGSIVALLLWTYRNGPEARQTAARIARASHALWGRFAMTLRAASCANMHRVLR